ncbi:MAG: D-alanine-D-alanine ligase [Actinomycetota bacterium]|jgi:D-alanine-D-alanine ligase|nr:D-alanine-D-alanine ligase [Actinomycetota bacterium]
MSDLGHVLVLAGGLSYEREVSLSSGRRVADALAALGVEVEIVDIDAQLLPRLRQDPPSAVFLAVHGLEGEDGALRDALDLSGVPYVGATGSAARLAFDKAVAKAIVARAGLHTPASVALQHAAFRDLGGPVLLDRIVERLGLPLVVKPARGGSAMGVTIVTDAAELPHAMVGCYSYDSVALLERHVAGIELAVSVVDDGSGPIALPAVEIEALSGFFDYAARYTAGMTEYHVPARLSPELAAAAGEAAVLAHRALGLRDLSRTDLIVAADGSVQYLETNVAPGMTTTSLLPLAAAAADLDLGALCRDLLQHAAARGVSLPGAPV